MKRLYAVKEGGECRNEGMMIGLMVRMRTSFLRRPRNLTSQLENRRTFEVVL